MMLHTSVVTRENRAREGKAGGERERERERGKGGKFPPLTCHIIITILTIANHKNSVHLLAFH